MHENSSCAVGAKDFVSARLSEMRSALDGFSIAPKLNDLMMINDLGRVADRSTQRLVVRILTAWAAAIESGLEWLPSVTAQLVIWNAVTQQWRQAIGRDQRGKGPALETV